MLKPARIGLILSLLFSLGQFFSPDFQQNQAWQEKIDPLLLESTSDTVEFILFLTKQADLSGAALLKTRQEKGTFVYNQLTQTALRTQPGILELLARSQAQYRSYWVANMIWVRGSPELIQQFAMRNDVARVYANPRVHLQEPEAALPDLAVPDSTEEINVIEWNILKVRANMIWALGYTGQGITIGGQDTGYDWQHPALINQYRGWDGKSADHNYNWHDAIHPSDSNNSCGYDLLAPCDDGFHGTHTMGTMVGDDGGSNQIGMAPGARWIGCRNMDEGYGTPITYSECYQWFIAPTDLNNLNPRVDLAPDVINNSWGCPVSEGCTDPLVLLSVVQNVRAAGIVTVHSAGNNGSLCETVNTPAAIYDESFTVGNTNIDDMIVNSSSRGPVTVDGSNRIKPDVSAPGYEVRSSVPGGSYATYSGTSMSAPHVTGLVALAFSARNALTGHPDLVESLIALSAVPRTTTQDCGGVDGESIPNNTYGYGRVDAWNALGDVLPLIYTYLPLTMMSP